jgi:colanic acid biosynthesis glycosyl transferase WcaI
LADLRDGAQRTSAVGPGPRPHILVLNEYYAPGVEATAQLLTDLCEGLAESFDITVVTGTAEGTEAGISEQHGIRVVRLQSTHYERRRLIARGLNYFSYMGLVLMRALRAERPDLVFCMTDPPFLGSAGLVIGRRFRAPLVVTMQDVFPEVAVELGRIRNPLVVSSIRMLVNTYLRRADRIVAIGETMKARLEEKGAHPERIRVIPNWVDTKQITPQPRDNDWAREHGVDGAFVVMHSGNVGEAQDLDTLIRAAASLRDLKEMRFLIIGGGSRYRDLEALAEKLKVEALTFLPYQPRERLSQSLSAATVHFVGLARGLAGYVVPSRFYSVLAAGRPAIVAADEESETAQVVREVGCGVGIAPGDPIALAHALREAHAGKLDLEAMGQRGRAYVVAEADRDVAISRYRAVFREVLDDRDPRRGARAATLPRLLSG